MSRSSYFAYILRRLVQAVVVVALTYTLTFLIIHVLPGDAVTNMLLDPDNGFSAADIAPIVAHYGLDRPVPEQLWMALSRFVIGDFGTSLRSNLPVSDLLFSALPSTLGLAGAALAVALAAAFLTAYGAQTLPPKLGRGVLRAVPSLSLSIPGFVIGIALIEAFAFHLGLFRITDPDGAMATVFAAIALGIPVSAQMAEVLITNLDHESQQDYALVARARGLAKTALFLRHLLRPSSLPVVTMIALAVGELLGGSLVTESVFGRVGIGALVQSAVSTQDFPVLQAVVSFVSVVFVGVNLLADLIYPLLDPRLRTGPAVRDLSSNGALAGN